MSSQPVAQRPSGFLRSFHVVAKPVGASCNLDCNYYGSNKDDTVFNAIHHCTWMCYVGSMYSCSVDDARELGQAHEDFGGQPNPGAGMDLYNNSVGLDLAENGQSAARCRDKCEQKAKEGKLYWSLPLPDGAPNPWGLPGGIPGFSVDGQGRVIVPPFVLV
jgi:hypothetical protein